MLAGIKVLGDVHAGKKFVNDVPLHRRGEREQMVMAQLQEELQAGPETLAHIQVGDLFDAFEVSNMVVLQVANAYLSAAMENPHCTYIVYPGNHDRSRDTAKASSFDLFAAIVEGYVTVVREPTIGTYGGHAIGIMPWNAYKSAEELAQELVSMAGSDKLDAVFAHCDFESFGGNDYNVLPTKTLALITKSVVTGHVHTAETFERDGVTVTGTGSMQPYSYSEDKQNLLYITLDFEEYQVTPKVIFENKYVRVRLRKGQEVTEVPNCLGFKTLKVADNGTEEEQETISLELKDFNTRDIFVTCLVEKGVSQEIQEQVLTQFDSQA